MLQKWKPIVYLTSQGLKCDSDECDFYGKDLEIKKENIGLECPKCGSNLLTKEDYAKVNKINWTCSALNVLLFPLGFLKSKKVVIKCSMNGSGQVKGEELL